MAEVFTSLFNMTMRLERERYLGAGHCERTPERRGYVSGYKTKGLDTPAGAVTLRQPSILLPLSTSPRHHPPAGRGRGHRPDGARHSRRHPTPSSAAVMRVTSTLPGTEQERQDRSAYCAEKGRFQASRTRLRGQICLHSSGPAIADDV